LHYGNPQAYTVADNYMVACLTNQEQVGYLVINQKLDMMCAPNPYLGSISRCWDLVSPSPRPPSQNRDRSSS